MIVPWQGVSPRIDPSAFVVKDCLVLGDVEVGPESSLWFGAIVRGDVHHIRIGARTNIQDQTIIHVRNGKFPTILGDDVTLGHRVTLHGCTLGDRVLVGIAAVVLDGAVIGDDCLIGAGALVTPGTRIPPRSLVIGSPARVKRALAGDEVASLLQSARNYVGYMHAYRQQFPDGI